MATGVFLLFGGPRAHDMLDLVIVLPPMSLGCAGLIVSSVTCGTPMGETECCASESWHDIALTSHSMVLTSLGRKVTSNAMENRWGETERCASESKKGARHDESKNGQQGPNRTAWLRLRRNKGPIEQHS